MLTVTGPQRAKEHNGKVTRTRTHRSCPVFSTRVSKRKISALADYLLFFGHVFMPLYKHDPSSNQGYSEFRRTD